MKISSFIISMITISLVIGVFVVFFQQLSNNYSGDFDNSSFTDYQKLDRLNNQSKEINSTLQNIRSTESGTNVITFANAFIASGWQVIKATFTSFDIFTDMISNSFSNSHLGEGMNTFQVSIFLIGFFLFAFAIISILVGRDV